jgi:hypothetical protein
VSAASRLHLVRGATHFGGENESEEYRDALRKHELVRRTLEDLNDPEGESLLALEAAQKGLNTMNWISRLIATAEAKGREKAEGSFHDPTRIS